MNNRFFIHNVVFNIILRHYTSQYYVIFTIISAFKSHNYALSMKEQVTPASIIERVVFVQKEIDVRFQSNATFLFSKVKR